MSQNRPSRSLTALLLSLLTAVAALLGTGLPAQAQAKPPASAFVTRDGTQLRLDGKPFRFAGSNMYWLGLDENVSGVDPEAPGAVDYPTYFRIRDGLEQAKAMGSTVVRGHTIGVSTGTPKALEPTLGRFNQDAFAPMDYAVAEAGRLGLKLIVPLTDNWKYYHGGRFDFLIWLGLSTDNDGALFYTDPDARAAYQQYVRVLLAHRNPYTGLRYSEDPTIMAWELGNELNGMTPEWIQANATYVKKLAPRQLVAAGKQFGVDPGVLAVGAVDISDSHYYPPTAAGIAADAATVTKAGKVYIAGEYGSPQATDSLLDPIAANPDVSGALFWSLFPHADHYGNVQHDDGFTLHYPGDTPAMRANVDALTDFAATMSGRQTPKLLGDRPLVTAVTKVQGINQIAWRGTAGSAGYRIQRSVLGGGWKTISGDALVSDNDAPWLDLATVSASSRYRVIAVAKTGTATKASAPAAVSRTSDAMVDPLEDWFLTSEHTASLQRTVADRQVEIAPAPGRTGRLAYTEPGLTQAQFVVSANRRPRPVIQVSPDGTKQWRTVVPSVTPTASGDWQVEVRDLSGVGAIRVVWGSKDRFAVRQVQLTSRSASQPTAAPGAFSLTDPSPGATDVSPLATLRWSAAANAAYYDVTVSRNADLSAPLVRATGLQTPSYAPTTPWPGGTTLYVAVVAVNGAGRTAIANGPVNFNTRAAIPGVLVDDFDTYADDAALQAAYVRNTGGDPIRPTLADPGEGSGHSMQLSFGTGPSGYAGVIRTLPSTQDWSSATALRMWVQPSRSGQSLNVQFVAGGSYWEKAVTLEGTEGRVVTIPFSDFAPPPWASQDAKLDLSSVTQLSLYPSAATASETLRIDSIIAVP